MAKRSLTATTTCVLMAAASTSYGFVCPVSPTRSLLPLQTTTEANFHTRNVPRSLPLPFNASHKHLGNSVVCTRRTRRRSGVTAPSMVYGGDRDPRGPLGLSPGTLATAAFALLFVFAPGVIFGAFNALFLVVTIGPILLTLGFNLYNRINTIEAPCPVCGAELQGIKSSQNQCPSCGTMLIATKGEFEALGSGFLRDEAGRQQEYTRVGDSGVIDVDAIDVED